MENAVFNQLAQLRASAGAPAMLDRLMASLRQDGDYARLFDALLLKARFELGLPLVPSDGAETPDSLRTAYEDRVIESCRIVGRLFLDAAEIGRAFQYYHMIGELDPVRDAIDRYESGDDDEKAQAVIEVAVAQGVHPAKGLAMILSRYGTCQAITACEQILYSQPRGTSGGDCIRLLVRQLHHELSERVSADIAATEGSSSCERNLGRLVADRPWLFENENYHIDTSHLNAVVRMARLLPACDETLLAIDLCEYGRRLSSRYRYPDPAPFDDVYADSQIYFKTLMQTDIEFGLAHFRAKADRVDVEQPTSMPVEIYVSLLARLGRTDEALAYAAKKLNQNAPPSVCPSVNELCQSAGRFDELARLARVRGDLVSFAAGLIKQPS